MVYHRVKSKIDFTFIEIMYAKNFPEELLFRIAGNRELFNRTLRTCKTWNKKLHKYIGMLLRNDPDLRSHIDFVKITFVNYTTSDKIIRHPSDEILGDTPEYRKCKTLWNILRLLSTSEISNIKQIDVHMQHKTFPYNIAYPYDKYFIYTYLATQGHIQMPQEITVKIYMYTNNF